MDKRFVFNILIPRKAKQNGELITFIIIVTNYQKNTQKNSTSFYQLLSKAKIGLCLLYLSVFENERSCIFYTRKIANITHLENTEYVFEAPQRSVKIKI